ncbi:MAG: DNA translocase FtsK 4TM domain-containing protein [Patescibacteria group bacterium]|nr:DNA translocase FtsK [Patescibacteria group bacterium]
MLKKKKSLKKKIKNKSQTKVKKSSLHSGTKKGILAIISFTLAILSFLSFFNGAGTFGQYFLKISKLLFGQGFFLISVSFVLIGLAIIIPRKRKKSAYGAIFIGIILFIVSVLGFFYVINNAGGYLGMILGYPLNQFLGFWASLIVLLALLIISFLITFNLSLFPNKKDEQKELILNSPDQPVAKEEKKLSFLHSAIRWPNASGHRIAESQEPAKQSDQLVGRETPVTLAISKAVKAKQMGDFKLPSLDFLERDKGQPTSGDIKANLNIIKRTLENFGIEVEMAEVNVGPTVTQYTLRPAQGVKLTKIISLQNDLALALAAHPLRIEAPIPGRSLVGIEIPNRSMILVRLRSLLERPTFQESTDGLTLALGRDVAGNPIFAELARMPHLLVAGATGTGKTVALNNIIISLLYRNSPQDMRLILIDPKRVELTAYNSIPHLLTPVIVQADKANSALRWAVSEMERRFRVLQEGGRRDISSYNKKVSQSEDDSERLPYIVLVIDELADLMATYGRDVETSIVRLAQMARAVGIHLIVSTQRPSVEVITGLIKANITSRMAFQVASQIDSRTILDMAGAEKLLGNGDMLFLAGNSAKPKRVQGGFVSDREVKKVTDHLRLVSQPDFLEEVISSSKTRFETGTGFNTEGGGSEDELLSEAKEVVIQAKKASASLLQRRLRVGYARAARLLDIMEEQGIVGPSDGAKPREVYIDEGEKYD